MSPRPYAGAAGAFAAAALLLGASSASAHTIVGDRVFPATLAIDDPGVNDELSLPVFSQITAENFDGTTGPKTYTLGGEYSKTITANWQVSIGSEGVTFQRNPKATGFANIEVGTKYVFYQNPASEFIFAGGVGVEIGGTGSPPSSALPADQFTTVTPSLYVGTGFGDAPVDWMKPFAVTGEVSYSIPTVIRDPIDGSQVPNVLTYGGSIQYSLLYRNAFVEEVPNPFKKLIPAFEGVFQTPVANTGPSNPGDFSVHETTGVVGPSLYYIGTYYELGVMMQVPINAASGKHPGVMAILDFFLDDIAPTTLGKPLFGPPQARRTTY
ncbi:hypothetical protein RHAL1_00747 [Beijerinckiaceae bacterium RH AL1]|nr:hypothetical protein [Beijerinckiaceae bacterium]VVB43477.1 hypothetical protein RHAL8_00714 [Beijerinckiaceae bacterium RH AL8]VVB43494.1 hypothetical protein RHCH11_RHCH11_00716 [Beijerinckiaceae bacterium RH CH11]VVC53862.1 hypothetical protein RHAL1_00747 [Beijerinckiaceae bacterium RH AL1]